MTDLVKENLLNSFFQFLPVAATPFYRSLIEENFVRKHQGITGIFPVGVGDTVVKAKQISLGRFLLHKNLHIVQILPDQTWQLLELPVNYLFKIFSGKPHNFKYITGEENDYHWRKD